MATGMWTAVSGASAQANSIDMVANNLANTDTPGFKKDLPTFKEYLSNLERDPASAEIPRAPIKDKDFYSLDGRDQSFVVQDGTYTNFKQGHLKVTQGQLDLALDGPGFFEVSTPSGIRYTRHGSFRTATDGRLVTTEGYPVLAAQPGGLGNALPATSVQPNQGRLLTQGGVAAGQGTQNAQGESGRFISLKDRGPHFSITDMGEVYAGDELIAKLSVNEFQDRNKLRKQGGQLFENTNPNNLLPPKRTEVKQGMLETSNVNPVEEMTNLIKANRLFEHDLKLMKTYGEMMGREANDIGKL